MCDLINSKADIHDPQEQAHAHALTRHDAILQERSTASKDKVEPINNSMPVGLPVSASTFSHKGPDGHWTKYDAAQSAMIAEAMGKHPAGGSRAERGCRVSPSSSSQAERGART